MYKFKGSGVAAPKTTPAAQLVTLQPTCAVATGTITVSAPTEKELIALMVQLIPTLLEYLLMWLLQRIQLRLKMLQDLYAPTINAQPATAAPTAAATLQPTCAVAAGTITVTAPTGTGSNV
jgi:hypothetical protein